MRARVSGEVCVCDSVARANCWGAVDWLGPSVGGTRVVVRDNSRHPRGARNNGGR